MIISSLVVRSVSSLLPLFPPPSPPLPPPSFLSLPPSSLFLSLFPFSLPSSSPSSLFPPLPFLPSFHSSPSTLSYILPPPPPSLSPYYPHPRTAHPCTSPTASHLRGRPPVQTPLSPRQYSGEFLEAWASGVGVVGMWAGMSSA